MTVALKTTEEKVIFYPKLNISMLGSKILVYN